jgi:hypothetical protein
MYETSERGVMAYNEAISSARSLAQR